MEEIAYSIHIQTELAGEIQREESAKSQTQEEHEKTWETCEGIARSNTVSTIADMQGCTVSTCLSCYWQDLMDWCWHEPTILLILARSVYMLLVAKIFQLTASAADVFSVFPQ